MTRKDREDQMILDAVKAAEENEQLIRDMGYVQQAGESHDALSYFLKQQYAEGQVQNRSKSSENPKRSTIL